MTELNVSKPTLIQSRKYQFQIQNFRAIELEALREKWLASTAVRVNALGEQLRRAEAELAKRDIGDLPTARLFSLVESLHVARSNGKPTRRKGKGALETEPKKRILSFAAARCRWLCFGIA